MDNKKVAKNIVNLVGNESNINHLTHCATRLRFTVNDLNKVDKDSIETEDGVIGVVIQGKQVQVIIGNEVGRVYNEINSLFNFGNSGNPEPSDGPKGNILNKFLEIVSGIFTPILPAITGAGMLKAILALLVLFKVISTDSQNYYIISFISDATFYFLPMLLAYSSAKKFNANPVLAMVLGGVLLHPNLTALREAGEPVQFLAMPLKISTYSSSTIPIILIVLFMSYVEKYADKFIPSIIKFFVKPLTIILLTSIVGLLVLAPLGSFIGDILANGINSLNDIAPWLVPTVVGALAPFLVMTGMHYSLTPLAAISLSSFGKETIIGPGMLASNISQGANALAVAFKTKNKQQKEQAFSAGFTALLGITEPALYGVTIRVKNAFIPVVIGGALGGFYGGITGLVRYAFGSPGLAALPVYIGENPKNIFHALITIAISFVSTFVVAWFLLKVDSNEDKLQNDNSNTLKTNKEEDIVSIVNGTVYPIQQMPDEVFSKELMGPGLAFKADKGDVYSPVNGIVKTVFPTKHAVGILSNEGTEILIHIGIDTVNMKGDGFTSYVKEGDKIEVGTLISQFDKSLIEGNGYVSDIALIFTNISKDKIKYNTSNNETKVTVDVTV